MKKKINKKLVTVFLFLMSLSILIYGVSAFWIGFHNIDLCHNEISIQNQLSEELRSINKEYIITEQQIFNSKIWHLDDCYLSGLKTIIYGFYISLIGAFLLGNQKQGGN